MTWTFFTLVFSSCSLSSVWRGGRGGGSGLRWRRQPWLADRLSDSKGAHVLLRAWSIGARSSTGRSLWCISSYLRLRLRVSFLSPPADGVSATPSGDRGDTSAPRSWPDDPTARGDGGGGFRQRARAPELRGRAALARSGGRAARRARWRARTGRSGVRHVAEVRDPRRRKPLVQALVDCARVRSCGASARGPCRGACGDAGRNTLARRVVPPRFC